MIPLRSLCAGMIALLVAPGTEPPAKGPWLAYASKRGSNWDVYLVGADDRRETRLTRGDSQDRFPIWSPDGSRIAFGSLQGDDWEHWELWVMRADGSGARRLTAGIEAKSPRYWSPDGRRILFESDRDGKPAIYTISPDGGEPQKLTGAGSNSSPTWSPDGRRIAFTCEQDGNQDICVMGAGGGPITRLTTDSGREGSPVWSPGGDRIAYVGQHDGRRALFLMRPDGSQKSLLTADSNAENHSPLWSPDGKQIAFQVVRGAKTPSQHGEYDFAVINVSTQQRTPLVATPEFEGQYTWSPDSKRLAFVANRGGKEGLYLIGVEGSGLRQISSHPALDPEWSPGN